MSLFSKSGYNVLAGIGSVAGVLLALIATGGIKMGPAITGEPRPVDPWKLNCERGTVERWRDPEKNVVCWVTHGAGECGRSIFCASEDAVSDR